MKPTYHTTDAEGRTLVTPSSKQMRAVLASLEHADEADFPDVSLVHESGWAITIDERWLAVLERVEDPVVAMRTLSVEHLDGAFTLWASLAAGDLKAIEAMSWREVD